MKHVITGLLLSLISADGWGAAGIQPQMQS